jgi:predicted transcriptional regulator
MSNRTINLADHYTPAEVALIHAKDYLRDINGRQGNTSGRAKRAVREAQAAVDAERAATQAIVTHPVFAALTPAARATIARNA